jgi:hypothetical protein
MRRMNRDDEGVVLVLATVAMTALLLMAAFALDFGQLVAHKERAQNSADARALAAALNCAQGMAADTAPLPPLKAGQTPDPMVCDYSANEVTATIRKPVDLKFVPDPSPLARPATAKWGALGSSTGVFPITVGACSFAGLAQNVKITLHSYAVPGCGTPSGNFGFVENGCSASQTVLVGNNIPGTTGNNLGGTGCGDLNGYLDRDVLIPVWDTESGSGSGGQYHVMAFALFHFTGWSTNGNDRGGTLKKQCDASADGGVNENVNKPCIRGWFKGFTTQGAVIVPGLTCGPTSSNPLLTCLVLLTK